MSKLLMVKQKRMRSILVILTISKYLILVSLFIVLAVNIYVALQPDVYFEATHETHNWLITAHLTNNFSSYASITPFIMQFLPPDMINAKHAFLLYNLVHALMRGIFIYCGIVVLIRIVKDAVNGNTPFSKKHIRGIKLISLLIIIWFGLKDILLNILFNIFITKTFAIDLSNIHLTGFILGLVIYLFAEIFEYGRLLQEDVDMMV